MGNGVHVPHTGKRTDSASPPAFADGIAIGEDKRYPMISMFRPEPSWLKAYEGLWPANGQL